MRGCADWMEYRSQSDELQLSGPPLAGLHYIVDLRIVAELLRTTGNETGAAAYDARAASMTAEYNRVWLSNGTAAGRRTRSYGAGQTVNAMPLHYGIAPSAGDAASVLAALVSDIDEHNGHLTTGFVGNKYVLPALTAHGQGTLALRLMLTTTKPSWGYQLLHGATTLWENWSGEPDETNGNAPPSHNHHFMGGYGQWLHESVVGLRHGRRARAPGGGGAGAGAGGWWRRW